MTIKKGEYVQTWWASGHFSGHGWVYGIVTKAGEKTFTVLWESGRVNRVRHDTHRVERVPARMLDIAKEAVARAQPEVV